MNVVENITEEESGQQERADGDVDHPGDGHSESLGGAALEEVARQSLERER